MEKLKYTPDRITMLEPNQVFVFGSNKYGSHGGGAARLAYERFGAEWGKGEGLYGQSYAIPTMQGEVETIKPYVDRFIDFAALNGDKEFLVTKLGCGIAGFREEEIAPLFANAIYYDNIILPESFVRIIRSLPPTIPNAVKDMLYGQTKTIIDILREIDKEKHFDSWYEASGWIEYFLSRNLRGDETGFNSMRAVWSIMAPAVDAGERFDIDDFEKRLLEFHDKSGPIWDNVESVYLRYCLSKIIRYVSFLNTFRRYDSYEKLESDLRRTVVVSACGENPRNYFFSIAMRSFLNLSWAVQDNPKIFEGGQFHPDELERALLIEPKQRIESEGVEAYIRENYTFAGCHTALMIPKSGKAWGPIYRILGDGQIEPLCNGDDRIQGYSTAFETTVARHILEEEENYRNINGIFVPVRDYTLPVIDSRNGILPFRTMEEKRRYIDRVLNADRR